MFKLKYLAANSKVILIPIVGVLLFFILYLVAASLYPGGSSFDPQATGFSWFHNFWCHLLNEKAINGAPNPAMPIAIGAMIVLCISLACFWWIFPVHFPISFWLKWSIRLSGLVSMLIGVLLFTSIDHDLITNLASCFGLIATLLTLYVLYQHRWTRHLLFGIFNLLLVIINNILYYSPNWILYLPLVQKFSFISFLLWISLICYQLYRKALDRF